MIATLELPVTRETSRWGGVGEEFWDHADLVWAWRDGEKLKVQCHDQRDCRRCQERGWRNTTQRLYPHAGTEHGIRTFRLGPLVFDVEDVRLQWVVHSGGEQYWGWRITGRLRS